MDLSYHSFQHRLIELRQGHMRWCHYSFLVQVDPLDDECRLRVQFSFDVAHIQMFPQLRLITRAGKS